MKWGVWCVASSCWLKDSHGNPKRFDEKLSAIVEANKMRHMLRRARPKYDYKVAPFVER